MRCVRCGDREDQPGVQPPVRVGTFSAAVNDTVELVRVPLCGFCQNAVKAAIDRALHPSLTRMAPAQP